MSLSETSPDIFFFQELLRDSSEIPFLISSGIFSGIHLDILPGFSLVDSLEILPGSISKIYDTFEDSFGISLLILSVITLEISKEHPLKIPLGFLPSFFR